MSTPINSDVDVTGRVTVTGGVGGILTADLPAHASTHNAGGTDALAIDAAAATGSLRTLGTGTQQAAAGDDARWTQGLSRGWMGL